MNDFNKILIANRGEIAVRVIRTAKALGYRTVAVFSEADADALHTRLADQAVLIGKAPAKQSYLHIERLLEAAQQTGADAIHPGYGFLSENAEFARACEKHDMTFIGPPAAAIELMGNKRQSKMAMLKAGVPCIPGYQGSDQSDEKLIAEAQSIGFPIMVKACAGGGGRGMRLVPTATDLCAAIKTARSEAQSAFGSGELILEKAMVEPRHIEIQVFADNAGNTVHLGERDCSIQRRHQKVVEEAPSPALSATLRQQMGEAAVAAAKACNYRGAGTVEFLLDKDRQFYFLEMNTRLQVEHPVTELITGQDLVAWQISVAAGNNIPLTQQDIQMDGHAIEVRLYAEDPRNNFLPQTGKILCWDIPDSTGVRVDNGIRTGQTISPHYDPILAKIIAVGSDREQARRRLACAVEDAVLLGVTSNQQFLANILRHPIFAAGQATTTFLEQHFTEDSSVKSSTTTIKSLCLAALIFYTRDTQRAGHHPNLVGWSNCSHAQSHYLFQHEGNPLAVNLQSQAGNSSMCFSAHCGDEHISLELLSIDTHHCVYLDNKIRESVSYVFDGEQLFMTTKSGSCNFINITHTATVNDDFNSSGLLYALMDGVIVDVLVSTGQTVQKGQTLLVLEAMKMEHPLKADSDGVIEYIHVTAGEQVKNRQLVTQICIEHQE